MNRSLSICLRQKSALIPPFILLFVLGSVAGSQAQDSALAERHQIRLLDDHDHALAQRLVAIDDAEYVLDLSTFIIEPDPIALDILWHLHAAAQRGVRVRLLLDAQFNRLPKATVAALEAEGVHIRQYHPFRWYKPGWVTTRLHDKILIADALCEAGAKASSTPESPATLLLGGRNLSQPYFGIAGDHPRAYVDRDIEVSGPVTSNACRYFDALWNSDQTRAPRLGHLDPERDLDRCERHPRISRGGCRREVLRRDAAVKEALAELDRAHATATHPKPATPPPTFEVGAVQFLADPVGAKDFDLPVIGSMLQEDTLIGPQLLEVVARAQSSLIIESPYLVPSRGFRNAIRRARARGLEIRILTNSLLTTDNLLPQAAYRNAQSWLLEQGVELWEYAGEESMHAKSAVLDGRIGIVGSYNLDPRSEHLNTEIALVIEDEPFAQALLASMNERHEQSWHVTVEGIANLPDDESRRHPGVKRKKIVLLSFLRLVAPLLKRQI